MARFIYSSNVNRVDMARKLNDGCLFKVCLAFNYCVLWILFLMTIKLILGWLSNQQLSNVLIQPVLKEF